MNVAVAVPWWSGLAERGLRLGVLWGRLQVGSSSILHGQVHACLWSAVRACNPRMLAVVGGHHSIYS